MREPPAHAPNDVLLRSLGEGERDAIKLASVLHADSLLIDEREGVKAALRTGLRTTGTIGVLNLAAKQGLLDLAEAFARLRQTTFRYPEDLLQKLLAEHVKAGEP